jgi:hypothetical protein
VVNLTAGTAACPGCLASFSEEDLALLEAEPVDDRCDLCEKPTARFRELMVPVGGCLVGLNACPGCADWVLAAA